MQLVMSNLFGQNAPAIASSPSTKRCGPPTLRRCPGTTPGCRRWRRKWCRGNPC
ncbi:pPE FAMILY PROTEIN [Mycobacterium ulcerans str. Harvey]|uniref:PPE FAMILY PROTEIN n=1 Tax=Mycobacterium ulcerans str. Harvey TaxID=1299332 RepID=A0ABN0QWB5_MYCUL|nr:hypothetical protein [Mycobacterium ulcerans]EUA89020.1 pPE FAMILY PROTEIN [Mycobacterium ulcerans str. Harvey]